VDVNTDKVSSRTKKIDMTPIRLEGDDDDDDEGGGDDGDGGSDEDEDEDEESTPVPRSKRHVAQCVFLFCFILYLNKFSCLLTMNYIRALQKNYYRKACSRESKIPQKRHGQPARQ
jgi:hypothetical protein